MQSPYRISFSGNHLMIERIDGKSIRCTWDTLQKIKNEMAGEDACMIEFFPAQSDVVNEINRRHFWITEESPPLSR